MKFILVSLAGFILVLTLIEILLKKYRPNRVSDNRWKLAGLLISFVFMVLMGIIYYRNPTSSNINKLVIPVTVFLVFLDIYRRSRKG